MKFLHIGDLHLGKVINNFSMLEDQRHVLRQIVGYAKEHRPHAVVLAGDIYDRSVPPAAAVSLYGEFLKALLIDEKIPVLAIAGNHDGADMIHFGNELFEAANYFVAGHYTPVMRKATVHDEFGPVHFHLLPFADYAVVREAHQEKDIKSLEDASKLAVESNPIEKGTRNVMVTHAYLSGGVTALEESDSEKRLVIGGKETVSASLFSGYDYVALGHLHRAQPVMSKKIRYSGSILKYSFSEENDKKSITLVEMDGEGQIETTHLPLTLKRDLRTLKGTLEELLNGEGTEDYVRVVLTDEGEIMEPMAKLRTVYPHIMALTLAKNNQDRFQSAQRLQQPQAQKSAVELFSDFYAHQREKDLPEAGRRAIETILKALEG